jgi:hypothetical protein
MTKSLVLALSTMLCACGIAPTQPDFSAMMFMEGVKDGVVTGAVGEHFESRVLYSIGWHPGGGQIGSIPGKSAINTPEYALFGATSLPPGLSFDRSTGVLAGVPTQPGSWRLTPAVRDRDGYEYQGQGFWFTQWVTDSSTGKRYYQDKNTYVIRINR